MNNGYYDFETPRYRTDELQTKGYTIVQDKQGFCFGTDAVLLSDFAATYIHQGKKVLDLCTGNGIVPILLCSRKDYRDITAVDFDLHCCELTKYNTSHNHLDQAIKTICADVKNLPVEWNGRFDAITVNPPYFKQGSGIVSKASTRYARHETALPLHTLISTAHRLLKGKGSLFLVHKPHRTAELIALLKEYHLEPKVLQFVYAKASKPANLVLIRAVKNADEWVDVPPPIILYEEDGTPTKEYQDIYQRESS